MFTGAIHWGERTSDLDPCVGLTFDVMQDESRHAPGVEQPREAPTRSHARWQFV